MNESKYLFIPTQTLKGQGKVASMSRIIQNLFVIDLVYPNSVLIPKQDLIDGKHYYIYNPKDSKEKLPVKIRMLITLLLKERNLKHARKQRLELLERQIMEKVNVEMMNNSNYDISKILISRISDLENQIEILSNKLSKMEIKKK